MTKMIKVDYSYIDGAHFFSGRDPMALGLCVAHKDLKTAFEEFAKWVAKVQEAPAKVKAKKSAVSELPFLLEAA